MQKFKAIRPQRHDSISSFFERFALGDTSFFDTEVVIIGHVVNSRVAGGGGGKYLFLDLSDGSIIEDLKCICDKNLYSDGRFDELFKTCSRGIGLKLTGILTKFEKATQPFELKVSASVILGPVQDPATYVLSGKQKIGREIMCNEYAHLRGQTKTGMAISLVRAILFKAVNKAMSEMGIKQIDFVGLTENDCEGGAEQFLVTRLIKPGMRPQDIPVTEAGLIDFTKDFFARPVYETCSGQLELEFSAPAYIWTRVSRAEPSTGPRHLANFDMLEWEIICEDIQEDILVTVQTIKKVLYLVLTKSKRELEYLAKTSDDSQDLVARLTRYLTQDWPIIKHEDAITRLLESGEVFEEIPTYEGDLTKQHERYITEKLFGGLPVFVCGYPRKIKSFYMPSWYVSASSIDYADCFDLLFPIIGEVVGGSMREASYSKLVKEMQSRDMSLEPHKKYLDIRANGSLPHGGAGLGVCRLMMVLTGILQARDMVEMPRAFGCFA